MKDSTERYLVSVIPIPMFLNSLNTEHTCHSDLDFYPPYFTAVIIVLVAHAEVTACTIYPEISVHLGLFLLILLKFYLLREMVSTHLF